jgi:hypothetical protein
MDFEKLYKEVAVINHRAASTMQTRQKIVRRTEQSAKPVVVLCLWAGSNESTRVSLDPNSTKKLTR